MSNILENDNVRHLKNQLCIARSEINNLRQQLKSLTYSCRKEIDEISKKLENWQCQRCKECENVQQNTIGMPEPPFKPIGIIRTSFPEKRATPRQPGICPELIGKLELNKNIFTNPEHALDGLREYSHMWILYHFHKNESGCLTKAKVAPPRLNGIRTGVFATRSPHRPNPIGLSLVKIDNIINNVIYFSGVDMVDLTPVIDIKPYIPQYDNPESFNFNDEPLPSTSSNIQEITPLINNLDIRIMDGEENSREQVIGAATTFNLRPTNEDYLTNNRIGVREAPDGEEEENSSSITNNNNVNQSQIRVPSWINQPPVSTLIVNFKDRALTQLQQLGIEGQEKKTIITNVLREDPRSVYLRERWGSHCYVFRIAELYVSCKFNDDNHTVVVYQVFQNDARDTEE